MDDQTRLGILARAETVPECERGQYIITETVKAVRASDAQLSDEAIRAEFMAWWATLSPRPRSTFIWVWVTAWTRHILTCGGLINQ